MLLNPLKQLKGKLNFLKIPNTHLYKIIHLANSIRPNQQSVLQKESVESILQLKSSSSQINTQQFWKAMFDLQCHNQKLIGTVPNSIFQNLIPQQKKVSFLLSSITSKLNTKQLAYLNLKIRQKMNSRFPKWENLHLNNDSPSKRDIAILPVLSRSGLQYELKSMQKKIVNKQLKSFHQPKK